MENQNIKYIHTDPYTGDKSIEESVASWDDDMELWVVNDPYGIDIYFNDPKKTTADAEKWKADNPKTEYEYDQMIDDVNEANDPRNITNCDDCIAAGIHCSFTGHSCRILS